MKSAIYQLLGQFLCFTLATPLLARHEEGDWEVGIHRGQVRFSQGTTIDNGTIWGGGFGYCFTDLFELGVNLDRIEMEDADGGAEADLDFLTLDFLWNYGEDAHRPYLVLALGALRQESRDSSPGGLLDVGFGYRGYFNRHVGVRLDARLFFTDDDGTGFGVTERDQRWWLGVVVNLGR